MPTAERIDTPPTFTFAAGDRVRLEPKRLAALGCPHVMATVADDHAGDGTPVLVKLDAIYGIVGFAAEHVEIDWDATLTAIAPGWDWLDDPTAKWSKRWRATRGGGIGAALAYDDTVAPWGGGVPDGVVALLRRRNAAEPEPERDVEHLASMQALDLAESAALEMEVAMAYGLGLAAGDLDAALVHARESIMRALNEKLPASVTYVSASVSWKGRHMHARVVFRDGTREHMAYAYLKNARPEPSGSPTSGELVIGRALADQQSCIDTATGHHLDNLAAMLGVRRDPGQTDAALRAKLQEIGSTLGARRMVPGRDGPREALDALDCGDADSAEFQRIDFELATGVALDAHGAYVSAPRLPGESDATYRERLRSMPGIDADRWRGNVRAMAAASALLAEGVDISRHTTGDLVAHYDRVVNPRGGGWTLDEATPLADPATWSRIVRELEGLPPGKVTIVDTSAPCPGHAGAEQRPIAYDHASLGPATDESRVVVGVDTAIDPDGTERTCMVTVRRDPDGTMTVIDEQHHEKKAERAIDLALIGVIARS